MRPPLWHVPEQPASCQGWGKASLAASPGVVMQIQQKIGWDSGAADLSRILELQRNSLFVHL